MSTLSLEVSLYNKPVGTISRLPNGGVFFAFDETYLNSDDRPTLSQSFFDASGNLISDTKITPAKLPPFFANLLPEGHMRDYLAKKGDIKPNQEFQLIELLGQDLAGAITIKALEGATKQAGHEPRLTEVSEQPFRFSLAGVQLKFSALTAPKGGLTIPASGVGGDWIVKLPAQNYAHVPENEFAIMSLAKAIGIPVPEIKLVSLSDIGGLPEMGLLMGKQALAVKRFDRTHDGECIHIEDFAQVYNIYPEKKYEGVSFANITRMVWELTGESGLTDFIRRLTYTIMTGNGDMHLKNWSFIYRDHKTPELAPAYDMLSTIPYIPDDGLALKLGDTKDMNKINQAQFKKLISKAQVPERLVLSIVSETAEATLTKWHETQADYDLPDEIREGISRHMNAMRVLA